eukprot:g8359.t1
MSRFGQFVMGPAGSGKSTYCFHMAEYMQVSQKRNCRLVNLDPALHENNGVAPQNADEGQETKDGEPQPQQESIYDIDIRDLITSEDIQDELDFGPNGGLLYAMEYFGEHLRTWFKDELDNFAGDSEYFLFDCPGQIELYIHHPVMRYLVEFLQVECQIRLCGVFLLDASTCVGGDMCASKFLSGSLMALNAMLHLALPHLNLLSKVDLLEKSGGRTNSSGVIAPRNPKGLDDPSRRKRIGNLDDIDDEDESVEHLMSNDGDEEGANGEGSTSLVNAVEERFLDLAAGELLPELNRMMHPRFRDLNKAMVDLLEEYSMVAYSCLSKYDEECLADVAHRVNDLIQYYDDQEVNDRAYDEAMERVNERGDHDGCDADEGDDDEFDFGAGGAFGGGTGSLMGRAPTNEDFDPDMELSAYGLAGA